MKQFYINNYHRRGGRFLIPCIFSLLFILPYYGFSQNDNSSEKIVVTGTITDSNSDPLVGVNILERGTVNGSVTDLDGNFSIEVASEESVLVISYISFTTQEITIGNQRVLSIVMSEDLTALDEVVIVGFGKSEKKKLASSVTTVETDDIARAPYPSIAEGLAGRSAGVFIRSNGGEYGNIPTISIRGSGEPTYVVDGILVSKAEFAAIPSSDIDNISILKDAAATAVFGFDASNGILLVTTKKGKRGDIRITYNMDVAIQRPTLVPDYVDAYEFRKATNAAALRDGLTDPIVDETVLEAYRTKSDPVKFPNLNVFEEAISSTYSQSRHNLGLNGKINNTNVYLSADYFRQNSAYKPANDFGLSRYSFRSNVSHEFEGTGLTLSNNINIQKEDLSRPIAGLGEVWSHVRNWGSGTPLYNAEGNYVGRQNPIAEIDPQSGYDDNESTRLNGNITLNYEIPFVEGLSIKGIANYRTIQFFSKNFAANPRNSAPTYTFDGNRPETMGKARISQSMDRFNELLLQTHLNYTVNFNQKHNLELTGVYSQRESRSDNFSASRREFPSPAVDQLFAGSAEGKDNNGSASESGRISYIGRAKYDFDSKYIIEFAGTYDGFDGFEEGRKFNLFPSVAFRWNMDKESFFNSTLGKLGFSSFSLKGSWGETGEVGGRFGYIPRYNLINNAYFVDGAWVTGFRDGGLVPTGETATWFTKTTRNLGFDYSLFDYKLSGTLDFFFTRTTGFIAQQSDQYTTPLGTGLPPNNTDAAFRRGGFDGNINYRFDIGDRKSINIGANFSYYDQLWEKRFDETEADLKNPYTRLTHETDFVTRGYTSIGFYQNTEQLLTQPRRLGSTAMQLGDLIYEDFNGDGKITGDDFNRIGKSSFPHLTYGINTGLSIDRLQIDVLFQGVSNTQIYIGNIWQGPIYLKNYNIQLDAWSEDNPDALFPRISTIERVNGSNNQTTSDFYLKDAWYVRLKSISVAYDLGSLVDNKASVFKNLQILVSGVNLWTISPIKKFFIDPETSNNNNYGYPIGQTFNIGLRASL